MGCGGSKSPDATDPSASEVDPTADAPPVSRNPGVTSASEVTVSVSDPGSSASAGAPATDWPSFTKGSKEESFNKKTEGGTLVSKKTEVEATEGEMVRKGKKGAAPPPPVKHSFEWE